ncbi:MAG: hypothetical protein IJM14_00670 [Lachnospiraceae bacterium]|nr:hypothetical protein [Lachnospiraceae bacterium]
MPNDNYVKNEPMPKEFYSKYDQYKRYFEVSSCFIDDINENPELNNELNEIQNLVGENKKGFLKDGKPVCYVSQNKIVQIRDNVDMDIVDRMGKFNKKVKDMVDNMIENPTPQNKPFIGYLKVNSLRLDPEFDFLENFSETPYTFLENFITGVPKYKQYEPEEFKEILGPAFEPLCNLYDAYYDFMESENNIHKEKKEGKEPGKDLIDKKIKAMDALVSSYETLTNLPEETRKKLNNEKYLNNSIDHLTGRDVNKDRSPIRTIAGMKAESAALKAGYNEKESKLFYFLGFEKGHIQRGIIVLEGEKNRYQKYLNDGMKEGREKLPPEEIEELDKLRKWVKETRYDSLPEEEQQRYKDAQNLIKKKIKDYNFSIAEREIAKFDKQIAENNKLAKDFDKMIEYGLKKDPKNLDDKIHAFAKINKHLNKKADTIIHGTGKKPGMDQKLLSPFFDELNADIERQKAEAEKVKQAALMQEYDKNPASREKIFVDVFKANIIKNNNIAEKEATDYLEKAVLPETAAEMFKEENLNKLKADAEKINKYASDKRRLEDLSDKLKASKGIDGKRDFLKETIDNVSYGNGIGWFTKDDYKNILKDLYKFKEIKELRDRSMNGLNSLDVTIEHTENGVTNEYKVMDKAVIDMEKSILKKMDAYIARKDKEIDAAGNNARKNSIKRRKIMKHARDMFAEQLHFDNELVEAKQDIAGLQESVNNYEAEKNPVIKEQEKIVVNEVIPNRPELAKYNAKLKAEADRMQQKLLDYYEESPSTYGTDVNTEEVKKTQNQMIEKLKADYIDYGCRILYIQSMKDECNNRLDNGRVFPDKNIDKSLSEDNIKEGAKFIKEKMDAIKGVSKNFGKLIYHKSEVTSSFSRDDV